MKEQRLRDRNDKEVGEKEKYEKNRDKMQKMHERMRKERIQQINDGTTHGSINKSPGYLNIKQK
jgi:hypothetical protein